MSTRKCSPKEEQFVREYRKDRNATHAYIRVGYSPKGAKVQACRMLKRPHVKERIDELNAAEQAETEYTRKWVLDSLADIALAKKVSMPHAAISALREINRMLGYTVPDEKAIEGDKIEELRRAALQQTELFDKITVSPAKPANETAKKRTA